MSKINAGLMSSLTPEWGTPQAFFDELDAEFGFTLDVCADGWNHKCDRFFTKQALADQDAWSVRALSAALRARGLPLGEKILRERRSQPCDACTCRVG